MGWRFFEFNKQNANTGTKKKEKQKLKEISSHEGNDVVLSTANNSNVDLKNYEVVEEIHTISR